MPSLVQRIVREHFGDLSNKDICVMLNDCDTQSAMQLFGDDRIDKPGWLKWREDLETEREKRDLTL